MNPTEDQSRSHNASRRAPARLDTGSSHRNRILMYPMTNTAAMIGVKSSVAGMPRMLYVPKW
jgi:hypothetical protein